ncbi:MAG: amino acid permease [Bacteroidota bacterium]
MSTDPSHRQPAELARRLGFTTAVMLVVGSMIGSGIFKKPALMAGQLGSGELLIAVWVIAGVMTMFGALTNAEIASFIHAPGGQYVYFNKIYNKFVGYLYGWSVFSVYQTGSIAAIAYIFADYFGYFFPPFHLSPGLESFHFHIPGVGDIFPLADLGTKTVTIACVMFLTTVNYFGVRLGGIVQVIFTGLKVAAIAVIIVLGFTLGHGSIEHFTASTVHFSGVGSLLGAMLLAMSGAFWAYDGWINITYVAGEVKEPQRTIPRALFLGTAIVITVYVLTNLAYLYVLPIDVMAQSKLVAADVAEKFFRGYGGAFVSAAVMISTFGTANGTILSSARVYYAMAKERLFFQKMESVHPRYRTPGPSLFLQGIWASLLTLSGTFDQLTDQLIFVAWIFYALSAVGVFILRRKMADVPRPYRVWGYPYVPAIFVAFAALYIFYTLYSDITSFARGETPLINSVMGLVYVVIGIPGYIFWNRKKRLQQSKEPNESG